MNVPSLLEHYHQVAEPGVPTYEAVSLAGGCRHDYAVVVPVLNEGERFLTQIQSMGMAELPADIIVVDGGSTDGSTELQPLFDFGVRARLRCKPGLSRQMRAGMHWILEHGYMGVVFIDGNGKDSWWDIPRFVEVLKQGIDHAQGSRYIPGGRAINTPWDRTLAVRCLHAPLISLAARHRYTDTTNGFRAYSRGFLMDPRVAPFRDVFVRYNLHYYLAIRASRLGFRIVELPVARAYPARGVTPSKISGLRGKVAVLKQLFLAVVGAYDPM